MALSQGDVMPESQTRSHMNNHAFDLVGLRTFERVDPQLGRVRYPVHQLLILERCLVKLKPFEVDHQQLGTGLDPNFFCAHLLGEARFTLELIRLVQELLEAESVYAVVEARVLLDV